MLLLLVYLPATDRFGWLGFNCGSTYLYMNADAYIANRVALNMMLSASCSGLIALLCNSFKTGELETVHFS